MNATWSATYSAGLLGVLFPLMWNWGEVGKHCRIGMIVIDIYNLIQHLSKQQKNKRSKYNTPFWWYDLIYLCPTQAVWNWATECLESRNHNSPSVLNYIALPSGKQQQQAGKEPVCKKNYVVDVTASLNSQGSRCQYAFEREPLLLKQRVETWARVHGALPACH